ncbi:cytochrome c biogenesis CcdA family protein [Azospirillum griseum]|uniref:Cytochrome c biogenesis protein CcdA n=1 Tax=Azospirillum griseum TaxID=2496639 RepID=A0A3S0HWY1_9PROT|nr:cytochrome c biogenesis protein CcdA [Azospirillum griseum]RTR13101.1 cytochrome c biogenesis protein CcdA [Azospirillum griseum]
MGAALALSFLAGTLSTLSPCVLPLLPILLGGAIRQHRLAPLALAGGLALSFTGVGLFVATLGFALGIDGAAVKLTAALLMGLFGVVLLVRPLQERFALAASRLSGGANSALAGLSGEGLGGQFLLGLLLGAAWSPCAGPTLGAAVGMAAQSGSLPAAAATMTVFSVGAMAPLLALAYGSRKAMAARRDRMAGLAGVAKPVMGGALVIMSVLILSGLDKTIEAALTAAMPPWLVALTTSF